MRVLLVNSGSGSRGGGRDLLSTCIRRLTSSLRKLPDSVMLLWHIGREASPRFMDRHRPIPQRQVDIKAVSNA